MQGQRPEEGTHEISLGGAVSFVFVSSGVLLLLFFFMSPLLFDILLFFFCLMAFEVSTPPWHASLSPCLQTHARTDGCEPPSHALSLSARTVARMIVRAHHILTL